MIATTQCPSHDRLRRYALGEYTDEEGDRIESHLAQCPACEDTLAKCDDVGDSLVRHLPLTNRGGMVAAESAWLKRLLAGPPDPVQTIGNVRPPNVDRDDESCFDVYELSGVLGKGGMGVVYEARHRHLNRPVAIKVVSPKLVDAEEAQRRFDREIKVLGALNHPGIVSATDAGRIGAAAYLVMERIDGTDLATLIRKVGPLSVSEACEITRQIAVALAAAHDAGAIHRDVKPSNVMVDPGGHVKLMDFGLAHLAGPAGTGQETSSGRMLGTLDYMAPEQAHGKSTTQAVDLFALGATLFFLLTGRPPKDHDRDLTLIQQLRNVTESPALRLEDVRSGVPAALCELVARLLENNPKDRTSDAAQVAVDLTQWSGPLAPDTLSSLMAAGQPSATPTDDDAIVTSLSELLGHDAASAIQTNTLGSGKRKSWWSRGTTSLALVGLIPLLYFAIVLLLKADVGTLRIESEVAGVTLELLDEDDRVETVQIENREGETHLKAGKYRVRLAGGHDRLTVDPEVIVLSKDKTEIARVSFLEADEDSRHGDEEGGRRMYGGTNEVSSQKRFEADPRSFEAMLLKYNEDTREDRQNLFDPPIADLTLEQLRLAFDVAASTYRKIGKTDIAEALEVSFRNNRLEERLRMDGASGTQSTSNFKQIMPALWFRTGPSSWYTVVLSEIELRHSRDGWSSPDWGRIHPPLNGTWQLMEAEQNGQTLDDTEFEEWLKSEPRLRQLVIDQASLVLPFQEASDETEDKDELGKANRYHLNLDYDGHPARFTASRGDDVVLQGIFRSNAFVDHTRLWIAIPVNDGPRPESFDTEKGQSIKLTYKRLLLGKDRSSAKPIQTEKPGRIVTFQLGESEELPLTLDVPAGDVSVLSPGIYGRPSDEVASSFKPAPNPSSKLSLPANVKRDSQWVRRIPGTGDWYRTPARVVTHPHIIRREQSLAAGETLSNARSISVAGVISVEKNLHESPPPAIRSFSRDASVVPIPWPATIPEGSQTVAGGKAQPPPPEHCPFRRS